MGCGFVLRSSISWWRSNLHAIEIGIQSNMAYKLKPNWLLEVHIVRRPMLLQARDTIIS